MDRLYFSLMLWIIISVVLWVLLPLMVNVFSIYPYANTNDQFEARDKRKRLIITIVSALALPITVLILIAFLIIKIIKDVSDSF
jgi:heme/copper-type cytochrome/quinol oxidase subunit 2